MWENSYISHSGVNWQELHNCSNSWIAQWSISVIICQFAAVWDCSSRDECFRKWGAWLKCQYYFLKDKCSLPTSVLLFTIWCVCAFILVPGWESAQLFAAQPLLVGHIHIQLWLWNDGNDCLCTFCVRQKDLPVCQDIFPVWQFYCSLSLHMMSLIECAWQSVCMLGVATGKWYKWHHCQEMSSDLNLSMSTWTWRTILGGLFLIKQVGTINRKLIFAK